MDEGVVERLAQAETAMSAGDFGSVAGTLGDLVAATKNPDLLHRMHDMAEQGLAQAGRFGKGVWKHLLGDLDRQLDKVVHNA